MTPLELLQRLLVELEPFSGQFAVAGGLAASFYRLRPRLTNDVDIALWAGNAEESRDVAEGISRKLGFEPVLGWIAGGRERLENGAALLIARSCEGDLESSVDFLLPVLPWVEQAVKRAQSNAIDFGFSRIPTLTPEDVIIAKTFALSLDSQRFQDLDDLQSIFRAENRLDLPYIVGEFKRLALSLPQAVRENAPQAIRRVSRSTQRCVKTQTASV